VTRATIGVMGAALLAAAASAASDSVTLRGVPLQGPTGLRLLVADDPAPFVLDLDRRTTERITGLPAGRDRGSTVLRLGKDALVLSYRSCNGCPSGQGVYVLRHGATVATRLGAASEAVASRDGRGVWVLTRRNARRCTIRELGLDGRPRRAARRVSCRVGLVAELPAGLLVNSVGPRGSDAHSELLQRDGHVARFADWQPRPVVANIVLSGSDRRAPLILHDMRTGADGRLRWPARRDYGLSETTGDPNAARAIVDFAKYSPKHMLDLWLLDTRTRGWRHLPDMPAHIIPKATDVEWTPDGRVVILTSNIVGVWRPGAPHIELTRVKPPKQPGRAFVIW
jgi:hypothetical protein